MDEFDDIVLDEYTFETEPLTTTTEAANQNPEPPTPEPEQTKKVEKIKFNEALLMQTKGLPLLKNESQYIRFQGKGHEAADLKRLMTYYTIWANNLYPKFRFKDFARRVQTPASGTNIKKLVESWQDEFKEKAQARREVLQELSGETVGDIDGEDRREAEEESSDDDNRPLFFPISAEAAEAMKKNKQGKKKTKSSSTSNKKYRSKDTINSSDKDDDDDEEEETTKRPRTITFSDSEDEDDGPVRKKKSDAPPVDGRAHALAILAEKRKKKLQATPQTDDSNEKEKDEQTHVPSKSSRKVQDPDFEEEDFDEMLNEILNDKPSEQTKHVELEQEDVTDEHEPGLLDDIVMEDINDVNLEPIEMEEV